MSFGSPVVLQFAVGSSWAGTGLQEVRALQSVLLLTLFALGTVAFDKVIAHFGFVGHVDVAVGAVVVVADSLQEVGAHGHLLLGHLV